MQYTIEKKLPPEQQKKIDRWLEPKTPILTPENEGGNPIPTRQEILDLINRLSRSRLMAAIGNNYDDAELADRTARTILILWNERQDRIQKKPQPRKKSQKS